ATFGSVLTNTRNGSRARAASGDHATAMPSATPAVPARAKPPRISRVVTHRCVCHGTEAPPAAFRTASRPGNRYSRTPSTGPASCQTTTSTANSTSDGRSRERARTRIWALMIAPGPCATLRLVRWLIALPFRRAGLMGVDFAEELAALGHEVRLFAYRRDNVVYKNRSTKAAYQLWILRRLERACVAWRPDVVLVIKGGPVTPGLIRRVKARIPTRFVNFFPDNPLWMIPFDCIEAYDAFFTKERYAMASLQQVGLRNLHYLPMYCVPSLHHPVALTADDV